MIIPEQTLFRAVISRALLDLIEENGKRADHSWFGSYDFSDICGLAGINEELVLYIYKLIKKNPKIKKKIILLLLDKYQLSKEPISDIQEQHQSDLQEQIL